MHAAYRREIHDCKAFLSFILILTLYMMQSPLASNTGKVLGNMCSRKTLMS